VKTTIRVHDKWAEHKLKFCSCKDGSSYNSCKGLPNCCLRDDHPERKFARDPLFYEDLYRACLSPWERLCRFVTHRADGQPRRNKKPTV
jgi:hypothetical protein